MVSHKLFPRKLRIVFCIQRYVNKLQKTQLFEKSHKEKQKIEIKQHAILTKGHEKKKLEEETSNRGRVDAK